MMTPTLSIAAVKSTATRIPHLMPFHVGHTGLAPVSTYFRVKPAPAPDDAPLADIDGAGVVTKVAGSIDVTEAEGSITTVVAVSIADITAKPATQSPLQRVSKAAKRFISSFRGRTIHGVEITLPTGYTGIVLRGDADPKGVAKEGGGGRNGQERRSRRSTTQRKTDMDEVEEDIGGTYTDEELVRVLKSSAQFSSFVLWHPDIPVDEGKDEYLRSLTEWISLAAEIHRVDE